MTQTRLARLREQIKNGVYLLPSTRRAVELCDKFNISLRSAYRYIKQDKVPSGEQRIRKDGQKYSLRPRRVRSPVEKELRLAWQALNRAGVKASEQGILPEELDLLTRINGRSALLLESWMEVRL